MCVYISAQIHTIRCSMAQVFAYSIGGGAKCANAEVNTLGMG